MTSRFITNTLRVRRPCDQNVLEASRGMQEMIDSDSPEVGHEEMIDDDGGW